MSETNIEKLVRELMIYGIKKKLFDERDVYYTFNRVLEALKLDAAPAAEDILAKGACDGLPCPELEPVLAGILDYAYDNGLIAENTVTYRDLFDTHIMSLLTPPPSAVIDRFAADYAVSPEKATENYYAFSRNTDYIRTYRVKKDMRWKADTEYGELDITINLSKPEKDPKAIAAALKSASVAYPKCQLCRENEGYAGRLNHPARQNHRIIPLSIAGEEWAFQYSPYVYYNEHCIVFNQSHTPMKIDKSAFYKLFDFVRQFPHYFVGSNADLPIVGGSILTHEHFQGGHYTFAMAKAPVEKTFTVKGFEDVEAGIVKWPMSVIRIRHEDSDRLVELADHILKVWREYSDEAAFIYAYTDGVPHNTITPIARKNGGKYELDLVLRNNITTPEHPLGVYHPHAELHHIKKENIGLIEVMGLAVLPSRLKGEMEALAAAMIAGADLRSDETLAKHADWADGIRAKYPDLNKDNIDSVIRTEIGIVFMKVLEHAGVYKRDAAGMAAFDKFINML